METDRRTEERSHAPTGFLFLGEGLPPASIPDYAESEQTKLIMARALPALDLVTLCDYDQRAPQTGGGTPGTINREERETMSTRKIARNSDQVTEAVIHDSSAGITDDVLRGIGYSGDAFADALAAAEAAYGTVQSIAEEFGNGFAVLKDKSVLVGKKFLMLKWGFSQGDYGMFASVAVVTVDGGKYILNDGSTGICRDLHTFSVQHGRYGGFIAENGLRVSQYATCVSCGRPRSSLDDDVCAVILPNGSECGDASTQRGSGETYYLDYSVG